MSALRSAGNTPPQPTETKQSMNRNGRKNVCSKNACSRSYPKSVKNILRDRTKQTRKKIIDIYTKFHKLARAFIKQEFDCHANRLNLANAEKEAEEKKRFRTRDRARSRRGDTNKPKTFMIINAFQTLKLCKLKNEMNKIGIMSMCRSSFNNRSTAAGRKQPQKNSQKQGKKNVVVCPFFLLPICFFVVSFSFFCLFVCC